MLRGDRIAIVAKTAYRVATAMMEIGPKLMDSEETDNGIDRYALECERVERSVFYAAYSTPEEQNLR